MYLKNWLISTVKSVFIKTPKKIIFFFQFLNQYLFFKKNYKRSAVSGKNLYPCLNDKVSFTPIDQHYTYHPAWAARIIAQIKPKEHIDVSSILHFGTILSAFVPVKFYDYRPAKLTLDNYFTDFIDLKKLSFESNSIMSISCMHTIEHIGLGRYGDELDVDGDIKSINELKRVLAFDGNLLFVTPVGKPKIAFNAHRIYSYEQIIDYFCPLELIEFSLIPDSGGLIRHANPSLVSDQEY
jgi:hypothetical protein